MNSVLTPVKELGKLCQIHVKYLTEMCDAQNSVTFVVVDANEEADMASNMSNLKNK